MTVEMISSISTADDGSLPGQGRGCLGSEYFLPPYCMLCSGAPELPVCQRTKPAVRTLNPKEGKGFLSPPNHRQAHNTATNNPSF